MPATIRSQSLGISYGTPLSIENALGVFKPDGDPAWDALDWAVFAAKQCVQLVVDRFSTPRLTVCAHRYGLRLVLPLTDQYDYYHGSVRSSSSPSPALAKVVFTVRRLCSGIPTFLRWRNLSSTDYTPFYDLESPVFADFTLYIRTLLNHTSPYTHVRLASTSIPTRKKALTKRPRGAQLSLANDPTILAFELGNELGGYSSRDYPPPVEWSTAVATLLKQLAPKTLVVSGSYGVREDEARVEEIDILCAAISHLLSLPHARRLTSHTHGLA